MELQLSKLQEEFNLQKRQHSDRIESISKQRYSALTNGRLESEAELALSRQRIEKLEEDLQKTEDKYKALIVEKDTGAARKAASYKERVCPPQRIDTRSRNKAIREREGAYSRKCRVG